MAIMLVAKFAVLKCIKKLHTQDKLTLYKAVLKAQEYPLM